MFGMIEQVILVLKEQEAFNKMCDSLPKERSNALRETRRKQWQEELEHNCKLEIAREGRSLNFWGNR